MIVVKDLRVDVLGEPLFEKVNLVIRSGERIGVLGTRKVDVATFLGVIADEIEMDEGSVTREGERVAYVSGETLQSGIESVAKALHASPSFLLFDMSSAAASTDVEAVKRLIASFRGGMLIASEDPEVMRAARVTRIFEIHPSTKSISSYTGNYADYLIEREKNQARINEAYEKQQKEKRRLEDWLEEKRKEAAKDRSPEKGATIRTKAKYLQREILDKEIPKPIQPE
jgi:pleuromutilin/lincosamide/streptogramin A transport system ATP-binding/permease protein